MKSKFISFKVRYSCGLLGLVKGSRMLFKLFHKGLGISVWDKSHSCTKLVQEFFISIYAQCLGKNKPFYIFRSF